MSAEALLETRDLTVRYGGTVADDAISLRVESGRVVGLIGPNGAGKTSFVDAVTGFTPCTGEVLLNGESIASLSPDRRARRGLARTWQSVELFRDLTVVENLLVAARRVSPASVVADLVRPSRPRDDSLVREALEIVGLQGVADKSVAELSLGQQKLLGVARAIASKPHVILLDEPAAGLDGAESRMLGERLRSTLDRGFGLLLIDHDMGLVLEVCDDIYVLDFGRLIARGTPAEILADDAVVTAYLGSHADAAGSDLTTAPGP